VISGISDPIRGSSEPDRYWTTANVGEAAPDVTTPICWSLWGGVNETAGRRSYYRFGLINRRDVHQEHDPNRRMTAVFYGRIALNVDLVRVWSNRLPNITADDFELGITGRLRPDAPAVRSEPMRVPLVRVKTFLVGRTNPRKLARCAAEHDQWWQNEVLRGSNKDPRTRLIDGFNRFDRALHLHVNVRFLGQSSMGKIYALAREANKPEIVPKVFAAFGNVAETALAEQLWEIAHGRGSLEDVIRSDGFHGRNEGNPSGRSWREDPSQLDGVLKALADRRNDQAPSGRAAAAAEAQKAAVRELSTALSPRRARTLRRALRRAAANTRELELGKASFLRAIDGVRAAVRDLGRDLVDRGVLDEIDDAFFLTYEEHVDGLPANAAEIVAHRKERWREYRTMVIPGEFIGMPQPLEQTRPRAVAGEDIVGAPASAGVVDGVVRVVLDPTVAAPLTEGEILVCRVTDPSWTPLFLLAEALVIDVGGLASHPAIVARELGVPCVINTGDGSSRLRNGDLVRVDGERGVVTVLAAGSTDE
jgi:phosphohistidine swiveling domain-containing protein